MRHDRDRMTCSEKIIALVIMSEVLALLVIAIFGLIDFLMHQ